MYEATCLVLENIALNGTTYSQRGDAASSFKFLMSFDFPSPATKFQHILNAMHLVTTIKTLIYKLRDDGWKTLLEEVTSFCKHQYIEFSDMDACYSSVGRSRCKKNQ